MRLRAALVLAAEAAVAVGTACPGVLETPCGLHAVVQLTWLDSNSRSALISTTCSHCFVTTAAAGTKEYVFVAKAWHAPYYGAITNWVKTNIDGNGQMVFSDGMHTGRVNNGDMTKAMAWCGYAAN